MKITYINDKVTGINRHPNPDESAMSIDRSDLVWGMINKYYSIVNGKLLPVSPAEKAIIDSGDELEFARAAKIAEIKQAYADAEETSTITINGTTYRADRDFLSEVDLEKRLAEANGETTINVFDVDLSPHTVNISAVGTVMQQIRVNTKANFEKGKNLVRQANLATTVIEINAVKW